MARESVLKRVEEFARGRMDCGEFGEHLLRRLCRVDLLRDAGKLSLVFMQIVEGDLEQPVERNIDHFIVVKFLAEGVCAERKSPLERGRRSDFIHAP